MKSALVQEEPRTHVLVLAAEEEASQQLLSFAKQRQPGSASLTAIGAFERCTLGYFDWQQKKYLEIPVDQQVEVLSFIGNLTWNEGEPKLHAHVVVGLRDGSTRGGHLLKGFVRPTLEVVLVESPQHLQRRYDSASHIPLIHVTADIA